MTMKGINFMLTFGFVVVSLCFFITGAEGTLEKNSEIYLKQTSLISGLEDTNVLSDLQYSSSNTSTTCSSTQKCNNGGSCFNNVCICLPGTSGPFCDVIKGCSELNCEKDRNANCSYDQKNFKAFCSCKQWRHEFDYEYSTCKECNCDGCKEGPGRCYSQAKKCEFIQGKKTCTCYSPETKYNPKAGICESCDLSGRSLSCEFDQDGNRIMRCKDNYQQQVSRCEKCDCGWWGKCKFNNYNKVCSCDSGYQERNGECIKCDCGNGKCKWELSWSYRLVGCICDSGYFEENLKCIEMKTCYCGENATCKFVNGDKKCDCAAGYQDINGICADINECDNPKMCDSGMNCINYDGNYECVCKEGFQESKEEPGTCEDINECLKETSCPDANTECLNTLGSYKCYCKPGYATRVDENSPVLCESKTGWKLGYGLLIGFSFAVIVMLMIGIFKIR